MGIASTDAMVRSAQAGRYAVAAFNIFDEISIGAVIDAAEASDSPVILQTSVKTVKAIGAPLLGEMFRFHAGSARVDVALHLDHCPDRDVISECLAQGWSSVLFDASSLSLAQAKTQTRAVVEEAHRVGAAVESELENIQGVEDGIGAEDEGRRYPTTVVAKFIEDTGVDLFAPAIGTAHGLYKQRPRLDPQRVSDLAKATRAPLVLHGGTGLTADEFRDLVARGCAKVNISTAVKLTYMGASLTFLKRCEESNAWDPLSLFRCVANAVQATATQHLQMLGSVGANP
jgi:fructose-bisphosphate aldolase, class II